MKKPRFEPGGKLFVKGYVMSANESDSVSIVAQLKSAVKESGMTHYRIAKDAGIRQNMLDRFMTGERDLRFETAAKIAEALGLQLR